MRDLMVLATQMGRQAANDGMVDTCMVHRATGPKDELSGEQPMVQVYPDPAWPEGHPWRDGPAKSQTRDAYEQTPEAGGHTFTVQRYRADFPVGAFDARVDDIITWTSCPLDPRRVGTRERIAAPFGKSFATALRVFVERVAEE